MNLLELHKHHLAKKKKKTVTRKPVLQFLKLQNVALTHLGLLVGLFSSNFICESN